MTDASRKRKIGELTLVEHVKQVVECNDATAISWPRSGIAALDEKEDIVTLNVGGKIFQTYKQTLTKHSDSVRNLFLLLQLLAELVDSRSKRQRVDQSIFVDRDGEYFRYILNFLRGKPPKPDSRWQLRPSR